MNVIETVYGPVSGIRRKGCHTYLGIPFARPPVDDLAFRRPVPPEPWKETLQACQARANPIQGRGAFSCRNNSQDCLYLNIFAPEHEPGPLPVMVWIYGGSYRTGGTGALVAGSNRIMYDLSRFARETRCVVVTFNYRLNLYGFLDLHDLSSRFDSNCGLFDQMMALRFVRENIHQFRGDADNITVVGHSAGAACILALMTIPEARGLFHKAIVQSPCVEHFFSRTEAKKYARLYLKTLGVKEDHLDALLHLSLEQVGTANAAYSGKLLRTGEIRCAFSPTIDGLTLTSAPWLAVRQSHKPMLIGTVADESNTFISNIPTAALPIMARYIHLPLPRSPKRITDTRHSISEALTEHIYRRPIQEILQSYAGDAWSYRYTHTTPENAASGMGCYHGSELPVLFGLPMRFMRASDPDSVAAGQRMRAIWSRFAWEGDPGWTPGAKPQIIA